MSNIEKLKKTIEDIKKINSVQEHDINNLLTFGTRKIQDESGSDSTSVSLNSSVASPVPLVPDLSSSSHHSSSHHSSSPHPSSSSHHSSSPYPSSSSSIELESLLLQQNSHILSLRKYFEKGYKQYRKWLALTLGTQYQPYLNFCLARNMNTFKPYIMGLDLEVKYIIHRLEHVFGQEQLKFYPHVIEKTLMDNLSLSLSHAKTIVSSYLNHPQSFHITMSDQEFQERLAKVPTYDLDLHSVTCWRSPNHEELNQTTYPISIKDIINGENIAPPSAKHLGLQMLGMYGLNTNTNTNENENSKDKNSLQNKKHKKMIREPKPYGVTFIE